MNRLGIGLLVGFVCSVRDSPFRDYALVVQWIGREFAELVIQVRLLARAPQEIILHGMVFC